MSTALKETHHKTESDKRKRKRTGGISSKRLDRAGRREGEREGGRVRRRQEERVSKCK